MLDGESPAKQHLVSALLHVGGVLTLVLHCCECLQVNVMCLPHVAALHIAAGWDLLCPPGVPRNPDQQSNWPHNLDLAGWDVVAQGLRL